MAHYNNIREKIKAGIIGHAIGDALGVPVEFMSRSKLAQNPIQDMQGGGSHGMPPGTWSDDTSMEIAFMQSLIDCEAVDYDDIMQKFCSWWQKDEFTAFGKTFDIGSTCANALSNYLCGKSPLECGGRGVHSNGNGALMRILPLAFIAPENPKKRYELVRNVSSLTHANEISVLGCYIYVNFVCHLLEDNDYLNAYDHTQSDDYSMFQEDTQEEYRRILKNEIYVYPEDEISSSGYVVSTLEAATWCLLTTTCYEDAVLKAVNLGDDTDTVGAVTGSLAGVYYGYDQIPRYWIKQLKRRNYLLRLCEDFADTKLVQKAQETQKP